MQDLASSIANEDYKHEHIFRISEYLERPPRVLWASPYAMHDTSSGAALQCNTILKKLQERGVIVKALGGLIFDSPLGTSCFANINDLMKSDKKFFYEYDHGIEYIIVKTKSYSRNAITNTEQNIYYEKYLELLDNFKPDILIGNYSGILTYAFRHEAARRGIPSIFVICNPSQADNQFRDNELVVSDSCYSAALAMQRGANNVVPIGQFIAPDRIVAEKREPKYVTLVNPTPDKGIALATRLILMAQKELPEVQFLAISSRSTVGTALRQLHASDNKEDKPFAEGNLEKVFPNLLSGAHTNDMRLVYGQTRVLLAPTPRIESWGRVATEAIMNGIPVLAAKTGGLPEAVSYGGICLDVPPACVVDAFRLPTEEEMRPWMDALKRLLNEDWTEPCAKAAAQNNIEYFTTRFLKVLLPLFAKRAGNR